jgi:hypothetical protein
VCLCVIFEFCVQQVGICLTYTNGPQAFYQMPFNGGMNPPLKGI